MIRVVTVFIIIVVLIAPVFSPSDPMQTDPANQLLGPSAEHLLGTDLLGRDVLSRALHGGQRSLLIALLATTFALVPGVIVGFFSGLSPRWLDDGLQIVINAVLAFPGLMLALVVLTLLGSGAFPLALATGVMQIAPMARVTRAAILEVRSQLYIQAAQSLGITRMRLVLHHILPNIQPTLLAYTIVVFSYSLLNNAALSFLGLGGEPGVPDWGMMLYDARTAFRAAPWIGVAPGFGIAILVLLLSRAAQTFTVAQGRRR